MSLEALFRLGTDISSPDESDIVYLKTKHKKLYLSPTKAVTKSAFTSNTDGHKKSAIDTNVTYWANTHPSDYCSVKRTHSRAS